MLSLSGLQILNKVKDVYQIFPTAVIFAGGKSSRMKQDKALLPFGGYDSLSEYQYRRLSKIFNKVYISSKNNKFNFEPECIEDCYEESSPLVALISIFESLDVDSVFILSVDAPFIEQKHIALLYETDYQTKDVTLLESEHGIEPLCAIYNQSILPFAKSALEQNNHRLQSLIESVNKRSIKIEDKKAFLNLNHPFEYKEAIKIWESSFL